MPDGVVQWFDGSTGEAAVVRGGHTFPVGAGEVEAAARRAGARVHFDIVRDGGVERAVAVTLRRGTHVSPRQRRFGTMVGARRVQDKGTVPFAVEHPEAAGSLAAHPLEIARAWGRAVAAGDLPTALALYAPDAVVHADGVSYTGRAHLQAYWESSPLLGAGALPRVVGDEDEVAVLTWEADPRGGPAPVPAVEVRCRVERGTIAEQRVGVPSRPSRASTIAGAEGSAPVPIAVVARGHVPAAAVAYAEQRLGHVVGQAGGPVLLARLKLTQEVDPARERPAIAEGSLDLGGDLVRAHVAAHDLREASDLLERRLLDQLEHRAERRAWRRRDTGLAAPGEWRHGDLPARRPEWFDRPVDDRRLVRHKAFVVDELTPDEAVFDMEQLDYDFHLFRDLGSGRDALVARDGDGYRLSWVVPGGKATPSADGQPDSAADGTPAAHGTPAADGTMAADGTLAPGVAPVLSVAEAIERLDAGGERFVFFSNAGTGRGNVLYRRYDGHYGLVSPD